MSDSKRVSKGQFMLEDLALFHLILRRERQSTKFHLKKKKGSSYTQDMKVNSLS